MPNARFAPGRAAGMAASPDTEDSLVDNIPDSVRMHHIDRGTGLWLDARGNLYAVPIHRADLERALHLQRRITQHLAQIVIYLAAARRREVRP